VTYDVTYAADARDAAHARNEQAEIDAVKLSKAMDALRTLRNLFYALNDDDRITLQAYALKDLYMDRIAEYTTAMKRLAEFEWDEANEWRGTICRCGMVVGDGTPHECRDDLGAYSPNIARDNV